MRRQRKDRFIERRTYSERTEALAPVLHDIYRAHRAAHEDTRRPRRRKRAIVKVMCRRAADAVKRGGA